MGRALEHSGEWTIRVAGVGHLIWAWTALTLTLDASYDAAAVHADAVADARGSDVATVVGSTTEQLKSEASAVRRSPARGQDDLVRAIAARSHSLNWLANPRQS